MAKHTACMTTPIELQRQIDNLIRLGTVTEVRSGECRVQSGDNHTNWRPYFVLRAGRTRRRMRPSIGEQVALFSPSGDLRNALVLAGLNQDDHPEPAAGNDNGDLDRTEYPDGAVIEYDPATGALSATGIKTATLKASLSVTLDTPKVICTQDLAVANRITSVTAKIGDVEVTEHGHEKVTRGNDQSGGPV